MLPVISHNAITSPQSSRNPPRLIAPLDISNVETFRVPTAKIEPYALAVIQGPDHIIRCLFIQVTPRTARQPGLLVEVVGLAPGVVAPVDAAELVAALERHRHVVAVLHKRAHVEVAQRGAVHAAVLLLRARRAGRVVVVPAVGDGTRDGEREGGDWDAFDGLGDGGGHGCCDDEVFARGGEERGGENGGGSTGGGGAGLGRRRRGVC